MTLHLYGAPRSRSSMVRWYLEEKGIPHELVELDMKAGEHRREPFTAINPFGKVPALMDEGFRGPDGGPLKLFESGAILLHLAEHHGGEFHRAPAEAAALRSLTAQWILFANATLGPGLFVAESREREFPRLMGTLEVLLRPERSLLAAPTDEPGVEDPAWGAADCAVQAYLAYLPVFFPQLDLTPYPNVSAVIAATRARPAYRRVMEAA
ncbi:MAG: glutathione S-transferase [Synechococcaceae cyanobacterium]|nr:glutathione S-transferase [Synechococcaceae cyanobacterium]